MVCCAVFPRTSLQSICSPRQSSRTTKFSLRTRQSLSSFMPPLDSNTHWKVGTCLGSVFYFYDTCGLTFSCTKYCFHGGKVLWVSLRYTYWLKIIAMVVFSTKVNSHFFVHEWHFSLKYVPVLNNTMKCRDVYFAQVMVYVCYYWNVTVKTGL